MLIALLPHKASKFSFKYCQMLTNDGGIVSRTNNSVLNQGVKERFQEIRGLYGKVAAIFYNSLGLVTKKGLL